MCGHDAPTQVPLPGNRTANEITGTGAATNGRPGLCPGEENRDEYRPNAAFHPGRSDAAPFQGVGRHRSGGFPMPAHV